MPRLHFYQLAVFSHLAALFAAFAVSFGLRAAFPEFFIAHATAIPATTAVFVVVAAMTAATFLTAQVSPALTEMRLCSQHFARGETDKGVLVSSAADEVLSLAEHLNRMARDLGGRLRAMDERIAQRDAVLSSMVEGVLALDGDGRILSLNDAAIGLFKIYHKTPVGKLIEEIVRNADLQKFAALALASSEPLDGDIVVHNGQERHIKAQASPLKNAAGAQIGALVVLHDVTRLRQLENIRKDFVANVSHELRTPLTAIKGFVESLLDGDLSDREESRRFLGIVAKQADRLGEIIEDLLSLSKIEKEADNGGLQTELVSVFPVLDSVVKTCQAKWATLSPDIAIEGEPDIVAKISPRLFEQAVLNLADNALKYNEPGTPVRIRVLRKVREVVVTVSDEGSGIAEEHVPRLFERFYRIDRARARDVGGTGLGLAIVKHIVQAHGGYVTVRSILGTGSDFSIHLPIA